MQLLLTALSSVLAQSRLPQEIIIVDDCSNDGTAQMIEIIADRMHSNNRLGAMSADGMAVTAAGVLAEGAPATNTPAAGVSTAGMTAAGALPANLAEKTAVEIRLLRLEKHSGYPGQVRNHGLSVASGDYVAFLDDDDQWLPQKLELQLALHIAHPECAISCSDEYWLRLGRLIAHPLPDKSAFSFAAALQKCTIGPSTAIVRRNCIDPRRGKSYGFAPNLEIAEDYHLWLRLLDRNYAVFMPKRLTIKCEYGQTQLSHKYSYIERFRIEALMLLLDEACLSKAHHQAAAAVCAEKCRLWSAGARKRGREIEARDYERMAEYVLSALR